MKHPKKDNELVVQSMHRMAQEISDLKNESAVVEWAANTVMTTSQNVTLGVDEVLHSEFHFTDKMIDEFHMALTEVLKAAGQVNLYGSRPMTPKDFESVGIIAKCRSAEEKALVFKRTLGISLPSGDPNIKYLIDNKEILKGN